MRVLVFGGSASGKSEYAEQTLLELARGAKLYLATMQVLDGESRRRMERHRKMRAGKGFETVECPMALPKTVPAGSCALLEDLDNLLANRMFSPAGRVEGLFEELNEALMTLERFTDHLVVVSGDLGRDGVCYPPETAAYLELLSRLHHALAQRYDRVVEVVCGLPVVWKGGEI